MGWLDSHILTVILMCPVVGLGLLVAVPEDKPKLIKQISAVVSGVALALCLRVWALFDSSEAGLQLVERHEWLPEAGIG